MKKLILKLFSFCLGVLFLTSCSDPEFEDSGKIRLKEKVYTITDFTSVSASSGFEIFITYGDEFSVSVSGDSRNLADLNLEKITDDHLLIEYSNQAKRQHITQVNITMPMVNSVSVSSVSFAYVEGFVDTPLGNIQLSATSHSAIFFNGIADTLNVHAVNQSTIDLSGSGKKINAYVSSDSQLDAFTFPVEDARIEAITGSLAHVHASDKLYAKVVNASEVTYKGTPDVTSLVDGSSIFGPN